MVRRGRKGLVCFGIWERGMEEEVWERGGCGGAEGGGNRARNETMMIVYGWGRKGREDYGTLLGYELGWWDGGRTFWAWRGRIWGLEGN